VKGKTYVSTAGASTVNKAKPARAAKAAKPAAPKSIVSPHWSFIPKFQDGGKDDSIYGFMLKRRF
jgi:hypothetical protein